MVKLLLTAPHTQTSLSQSCSQPGKSVSLSAPLSHVIVNCAGITRTENRGRRKDQGLCFGDKYSWSSVTTFTWSPFEARTAVTLPQPFPKVACSTTAPWDRLLQQDATGQWEALGPSSRGTRISVLIASTGSWTETSGYPTCALGQKPTPQGAGGASPSLLSSAAKVTMGGELSPACWAPGFKPVRQCLCSFTKSIQEFSQQRKHWHTGWLTSFLSFFLLSFFFFNWFFLQALSYNVLFHLIIAN